jgi:CRP-like cAMP-binding protein
MSDIDLSVEHLRAVPMFAALDDVALRHVSDLTTDVVLPAGHVLLNPGQEGSGMFVVVDGEVAVELPGAAPVSCTNGQFIGELSLLIDGLEHTARVRAAAPTRLLAISRTDFTRMLDTYPQIAVAMLKELARRLADTDALLRTR